MHSDVSHYDGLTYWGPMSEAKMEVLIALMRVERGATVADIGCGRAELLVRLAETYGCAVIGVDRSAAALAIARSELAARAPNSDYRLLEQDATTFVADPDSLAAAVWLGGPFLGASYRTTVETLAGWVEPGGYVLVGHGFWSAPPPAGFLSATGIPEGELGDHIANIETAEELGLRSLYTCVATRDEWDHFEGTIIYNVERYALAHPESPDPSGRLEGRRAFHRAQQRWGRDVMGFGLYLFQV